MPQSLTTRLTKTLTQEAALSHTLTLAQCDLLAWRPASATPHGQALYVDAERPELVTFCPTLAALRSLTELWAPQPYTFHITAQWDGFVCILTRYPL
jgi:hypothetical protein